MKILFENFAMLDVVDPPTYTSLTASSNYPVENLGHMFLRKRYQNVGGSDTVRVTFHEDETVNSFFIGYHNARYLSLLAEDGDYWLTEEGDEWIVTTSEIVINLYNYAGVLLYTSTMNLTNQFEAIHFADVANVRYAEIVLDWEGLSAGFIGGIGIGYCYEMPEPFADWIDGLEDNSITEQSLTGQAMQDYVEPKILRPFNFHHVPHADFLAIKNAIAAAGKGRPLWVDFTEDNHALFLPGYMLLENGIESLEREEGGKWSFSLTFKEAR
jgi:hypothetical protein